VRRTISRGQWFVSIRPPDRRRLGFCKLIADRKTSKILGCHIGERAVDIVQTAAIAIASGMRVDDLAGIPFATRPTRQILARAAVIAGQELRLQLG
jgi:pyruvate/2-oxoglutarate dehydrogenase complex dihydrolipoamide dehydrogenase (E3) component